MAGTDWAPPGGSVSWRYSHQPGPAAAHPGRHLDPFAEPDLCLAHLAWQAGRECGPGGLHRRHVRLARHGARDLLSRGAAEVPRVRGHGADRAGNRQAGLPRPQRRRGVLAAVVLAACTAAAAPARVLAAAAAAAAVLAAQLAVVRPRLSRRSARILAGEEAPRSRAHVAYIVGEALKVLALVTTGVLLLAA